MVKLIVFDIDGVLTDGSIIIDLTGKEYKRVNLKDVDAIYELHRKGYILAAVTAENTEIVNYFEERFPWDYFCRGCKKKKDFIQRLEKELQIYRENICYIGDGKYDVELLEYVGLGLCPADAVETAKDAADIILKKAGGDGCVYELLSVVEEHNICKCYENYIGYRLQEHIRMFKKLALDQELMKTLFQVGDCAAEILKKRGGIYLCGNGGSAADAQHIAAEFIGRFYKERTGLNAEALTVNPSALTAVGNDYSFSRIFSRQLEAKAHAGDMVIGISTSGTSQNVLDALQYAKNNRMIAVLLMGGFEHTGLEAADYVLKIPSLNIPRIQEAHIFIGHVLAEYIEHKIFEENT